MNEAAGPLAELSPHPGRRCVAAAPPELGRWVFAHTGWRLVRWVGGAEGENEARIRWRDIYDAIPGGAERTEDNASILEDAPEPLVERYGVDVVVGPGPAYEVRHITDCATG